MRGFAGDAEEQQGAEVAALDVHGLHRLQLTEHVESQPVRAKFVFHVAEENFFACFLRKGYTALLEPIGGVFLFTHVCEAREDVVGVNEVGTPKEDVDGVREAAAWLEK